MPRGPAWSVMRREPLAPRLVALDQMPGGGIKPEQVIPLLSSRDDDLRNTALWLVAQHTEWGGELAEWFGRQLATLSDRSQSDAGPMRATWNRCSLGLRRHPAIQKLLADTVIQHQRPTAARELAMRAMAGAKLSEPPPAWHAALAKVIADAEPSLVPLAVAAARELPPTDVAGRNVEPGAAGSRRRDPDCPTNCACGPRRSRRLACPELSEPQFQLLIGAVPDNSVALRSAAADAVSRSRLTPLQLNRLCDVLQSAGPLELNRLLAPFERIHRRAVRPEATFLA